MRLVDALQIMGLDAEISLAGRWISLQGERSRVYIVEGSWGREYFTWCDDEQARAVECYAHPITAIREGLRRAARIDHGCRDRSDARSDRGS